MTHYSIAAEDVSKIMSWLQDEVYPEAIAYQKKQGYNDSMFESAWESGYPYTGAAGGGLSYIYTPTSIGLHFNCLS